MIKSIVFSKDRPAQLHLFLQSLEKNARHLFPCVTVLYTYSDPNHKMGYEIVKEEFGSLVDFRLQENFKEDVLSLIDVSFPYTCFFTDDDVIFRRVKFNIGDVHKLFSQLEVSTLSLRLGKNTTVQDPFDRNIKMQVPNFMAELENKFLIWNRYLCENPSNFTYILSVDGHILRTNTVYRVISGLEFENPNQMEGGMQGFTNLVSGIMACLHHSCLVGIPSNTISPDGITKEDLDKQVKFPTNLKKMTKQFIKGKRLVLSALDFSEVEGCHQQYHLQMK